MSAVAFASNAPRPWLAMGALFGGAAALRAALYRRGLLPRERLKGPVISVGKRDTPAGSGSKPLFRRTRKGHYVAFGPTDSGRLLVIVFETKAAGAVRVITGWDMDRPERRYYQGRQRG